MPTNHNFNSDTTIEELINWNTYTLSSLLKELYGDSVKDLMGKNYIQKIIPNAKRK